MSRLEWPEWAKEHFVEPGSTKEAFAAWRPIVHIYPLSMRAICAATTRIEGCWTAYAKDVPGWNHREEAQMVLDSGDCLREDVALAMFPQFKGVPYAT